MISRTSRIPGQSALAAFGAALAFAAGADHAFAQAASTPASGTNAQPPGIFKLHREVVRGPVKPPTYPTRPQQEVRKLR